MAVPASTRKSLLLLLVWAICIGSAKAVVTDQFKTWYSGFGKAFENTKTKNCSVEYERYTTGNLSISLPDEESGATVNTLLTQPLVDCMLEHTSEFIKGSMTGAQVLLGVMPTVLSLMGPSSDEVAMVCSVARRPLLTLLLAFGSPSAYFSRAFAHTGVSEVLNQHPDRFSQPRLSTKWKIVCLSILQYTFTFAAAANVLHCSWEVGIFAVSSIVTFAVWLHPLWVGMGVFVHLYGIFVFRLRVQGWRDQPAACQINEANKERRIHKPFPLLFEWFQTLFPLFPRFKAWFRTEFRPAASMRLDVRIVTFPESRTFLIAAWLQSIFTIIHVVYGTLMFSSMIFIGTRDAVGIMGRFAASTLFCRMVVRYELAGLRETCVSIRSINDSRVMRDWYSQGSSRNKLIRAESGESVEMLGGHMRV